MKARRRWFALGGCLLLLLIAGAVYLQRANRASAIAAVREWGRLAPFPPSARDFTIKAEGSMFTRAFRVQFAADPETIESWLNESLGVRNPRPDSQQGAVRYFKLVPGGGAQGAELEIDDETHTVRVYVYWS